MRRALTVLVAAVTVAVAVAGCTSPDEPTSPRPSGSAPGSASATGRLAIAPCATKDLTFTLGRGEGALGSTYYPLRITNKSGQACRTGGFGAAAFVSGDPGVLIGRPAEEVPKRTAHRFVLQDGESAEATLRESNAGNYPRKRCNPRLARGLRVAPPGGTPAFVERTTTACGSERVQQLTLTPFREAR